MKITQLFKRISMPSLTAFSAALNTLATTKIKPGIGDDLLQDLMQATNLTELTGVILKVLDLPSETLTAPMASPEIREKWAAVISALPDRGLQHLLVEKIAPLQSSKEGASYALEFRKAIRWQPRVFESWQISSAQAAMAIRKEAEEVTAKTHPEEIERTRGINQVYSIQNIKTLQDELKIFLNLLSLALKDLGLEKEALEIAACGAKKITGIPSKDQQLTEEMLFHQLINLNGRLETFFKVVSSEETSVLKKLSGTITELDRHGVRPDFLAQNFLSEIANKIMRITAVTNILDPVNFKSYIHDMLRQGDPSGNAITEFRINGSMAMRFNYINNLSRLADKVLSSVDGTPRDQLIPVLTALEEQLRTGYAHSPQKADIITCIRLIETILTSVQKLEPVAFAKSGETPIMEQVMGSLANWLRFKDGITPSAIGKITVGDKDTRLMNISKSVGDTLNHLFRVSTNQYNQLYAIFDTVPVEQIDSFILFSLITGPFDGHQSQFGSTLTGFDNERSACGSRNLIRVVAETGHTRYLPAIRTIALSLLEVYPRRHPQKVFPKVSDTLRTFLLSDAGSPEQAEHIIRFTLAKERRHMMAPFTALFNKTPGPDSVQLKKAEEWLAPLEKDYPLSKTERNWLLRWYAYQRDRQPAFDTPEKETAFNFHCRKAVQRYLGLTERQITFITTGIADTRKFLKENESATLYDLFKHLYPLPEKVWRFLTDTIKIGPIELLNFMGMEDILTIAKGALSLPRLTPEKRTHIRETGVQFLQAIREAEKTGDYADLSYEYLGTETDTTAPDFKIIIPLESEFTS